MKKYKKILSVCSVFLLPLCSCEGSGPNIIKNNCKHTSFSYRSLSKNNHLQICGVCGKEEQTGHSWVDNPNSESLYVCAFCGYLSNKKYEFDDPHLVECEHEYKLRIVDEIKHEEICKKCGVINTPKKHTFTKDLSKESENKNPTCEEAGWEWQICECGQTSKKEIAPLDHSYTVIKSTTATCTEDGENTMECSRCGAESPDKVDQSALGHDWKADTTYTDGIAATCESLGTAREKCTRCDDTRIVETPALGHSFGKVETIESDGLFLETSKCDSEYCNTERIWWKAADVNDNCKNNRRVITHADPDNGVEEVSEPNYVLNSDGSIRFWGRPIHNACVLNDDGKVRSQNSATPVYDPTVNGSFFEYTINIPKKEEDAKIIAYMKPSENLSKNDDVFKNNNNDWTPGLIDSENNKYPNRYIVSVDGNELEFDDSYTNINSGSDWYVFPTDDFDLSAGEHTIKITMAGGYLSSFYNIGIQAKNIQWHGEHNFIKDTTLSKDPTCTEDGRFYGVCSCGLVKDEVIPAQHHLVEASMQGSEDHCDMHYCYCDREGCDYQMVRWNANEVNGNCINSRRIITPADPDNGVEEVSEPNYVEYSNQSVTFFGRPIHNAVELRSIYLTGSPNGPSVYDPNVVGSFLEYNIRLKEKLEGVKLLADMQPDSSLDSYVFRTDSNNRNPGFKDSKDNKYQTKYVLTIDGQEIDLDANDETNSKCRGWYTFPTNAFDLLAGDHVIRITMSGAYPASFYGFGFGK